MVRPRLTSSGMLSVPCRACASFQYMGAVLFSQLIMLITDNADRVCVSGQQHELLPPLSALQLQGDDDD